MIVPRYWKPCARVKTLATELGMLREDCFHLERNRGWQPSDAVLEEYKRVWLEAREKEERPAARDNAGRRAANLWVLDIRRRMG